jgi:hypothetical protein
MRLFETPQPHSVAATSWTPGGAGAVQIDRKGENWLTCLKSGLILGDSGNFSEKFVSAFRAAKFRVSPTDFIPS